MTSCRFSKMAAIPSQTYYFPFGVWLHLTFLKVQIYSRNKMTICLNPRLTYYYFRFLITNGRHTEILHPVSILTFSSPSVCDSASAYQIFSPNFVILDDRRRNYDVISILPHWGYSIANLLPVSGLAMPDI